MANESLDIRRELNRTGDESHWEPFGDFWSDLYCPALLDRVWEELHDQFDRIDDVVAGTV